MKGNKTNFHLSISQLYIIQQCYNIYTTYVIYVYSFLATCYTSGKKGQRWILIQLLYEFVFGHLLISHYHFFLNYWLCFLIDLFISQELTNYSSGLGITRSCVCMFDSLEQNNNNLLSRAYHLLKYIMKCFRWNTVLVYRENVLCSWMEENKMECLLLYIQQFHWSS